MKLALSFGFLIMVVLSLIALTLLSREVAELEGELEDALSRVDMVSGQIVEQGQLQDRIIYESAQTLTAEAENTRLQEVIDFLRLPVEVEISCYDSDLAFQLDSGQVHVIQHIFVCGENMFVGSKPGGPGVKIINRGFPDFNPGVN